MLAIEHLTKNFGGVVAVDDISFHIDEGEIVGLIGPNGAGKSTIFEIVSGFQRPSRGQIWFKGERIDGLKPHQVRKRGIARSFQLEESFPSFTPYEVILLASLLSLPAPTMAAARRQTREILETVGLAAKAQEPMNSLTLPDKKALEVGKVLALKAKMVLFDEVMAGLTPLESEAVISLIRHLRAAEGVAFLVVEHRLEIVMGICDRVIALNFGKKMAEGTPREVATNKQVIESYMGEDVPVAGHWS